MMDRCFTVSQDGGGDFRTVAAAVDAAAPDADTVIRIRNGIYREKLLIEKKNISLIGEDADKTVIAWSDGAYFQHPHGKKFGTFRSYTVFLGGERAALKDLTVRNDAGAGEIAGQALAVYADAAFAHFDHVRLVGRQDTLFLAPLPEKPRIPGSFLGPREHAPRRACEDYFEDCYVEGDVDFIFGGAEAVFDRCTLFSRSRGRAVNGYVAAVSTPEGQRFGFLFYRCRLLSDCPAGTVFLGRPWREFARTAFLECDMGAHVAPAGWSLWNAGAGEEDTVDFAEYACRGQGACGLRPAWVKKPTAREAEEYLREVERLRGRCAP